MARAIRLVVVTVLLLFAGEARATLAVQAPIGARPITIPDGQVACAPTAGEWTTDNDPHVLHPPKDDTSIGHVASLKVAPSAAACAASTATVDLIATGRLPVIDPASIALAVDEGRLDVRGRGLRGAGVHWQQGDRAGDDRCAAPDVPAGAPQGIERCSFAVARGLPADPNAAALSVFPAGGRAVGPDVATFDLNARRVEPSELALRPARVVVSSLVPANVSIDLAGDASRIPLTHPEAVASVDCGAAACELDGGAIVVRAVRNIGQTLAVRVRLAPHVMFAKGDALDPAPQFQVGVLPCAMSVASGDALRGVDDSRVVVRLDARCAGEAASLRFAVGSQPAAVQKIATEGGAAYVVLRVGRVEGDELAITALRGEGDAGVVGVARVKTRSAPQPKATIELEGSPIDFIPTNRPALVRFAAAEDHGRLALLPMDGVYEVTADPGGAAIRGLRGAAGFVALRFAYRVDSLPGSLASADLAVLVDPLERPLKEANVAVPLGASAMSDHPLVELACDDGGGHASIIKPGTTAHIPYAARDTCRLVLHKERLAPEDGVQRLDLQIDVTRVDGETRPDAHVAQSIVLRPGGEPRYFFIKGISGPFDHVTIRIAHDTDEAHYAAEAEAKAPEPAVQYSVIAGEGHARIYATTAIPTGLYRVSDKAHSGILTLNFGVIARLTWLDQEGHEGFLGFEGGVMGIGLANDTGPAPDHYSLTQVATVTGVGLSVPIANRSLATETSINLHAWVEYEVSRALGNDDPSHPGNALGFVFGPSISIGNIGANL